MKEKDPIREIMTDSELKDEDCAADEVSAHQLILLGILLCPPDHDAKANELYLVLQQTGQESISGSDKDIEVTHKRFVRLGVVLMHKILAKVYTNQAGPTEEEHEKYTHDDFISEFSEEFIDNIFGPMPLMKKDAFIPKLKEQKHLFTANGLREHLKGLVKENIWRRIFI